MKYTKNSNNQLPQENGRIFITDGGLETTLVFDNGFDLPEFAAFVLLDREGGIEALRNYYLPYIVLAKKCGFGFLLESPTWRASSAWGEKLGYTAEDLVRVNRRAIGLLQELRRAYGGESLPMVISGCMGPRGDGYNVDDKMSVEEARRYHGPQIQALKDAGADCVSPFTLNYAEEAAGITRAAQEIGIPPVISFTLETDGRLPSGQPLRAAIEEVDAASDGGPAYYMINCAHPSHFKEAVTADGSWKNRIVALRANASRKSHEELDAAEELDRGDPVELSHEYISVWPDLPRLNVFGGCCGTDADHLARICQRLTEVSNICANSVAKVGEAYPTGEFSE